MPTKADIRRCAAVIKDFDGERLPWIWSDTVPETYRSFRRMHLGAYHDKRPQPIILRGSRDSMYYTQERRRYFADKFVRRCARVLRITTPLEWWDGVLSHYDENNPFVRDCYRILRAAWKRWPNVRHLEDILFLRRDSYRVWRDGVRERDEERERLETNLRNLEIDRLYERERLITSIANQMCSIRKMEGN